MQHIFSVVAILCIALSATAQDLMYTHSYGYSNPSCGVNVTQITVWDSQCHNESATGTSLQTKKETSFLERMTKKRKDLERNEVEILRSFSLYFRFKIFYLSRKGIEGLHCM